MKFEIKAKTGTWKYPSSDCTMANNGRSCTGNGCYTERSDINPTLSDRVNRCEQNSRERNVTG